MSEQGSKIAAADAPESKIEIRRRGALVNFVLNRPRALNAFDDDMRGMLALEIPKIARNPDIYIIALSSASPRAFCAGGDVRVLADVAKRDMAEARRYFAAEYKLDWLLECFSKPSVSLVDGLCMGSGAGLSGLNTHRVAGENYSWAMPETGIGLFPDVGVSHVLARMPWGIGLYLGLTGRSIKRADATWLGHATHCIPAKNFEAILSALADAEPVDPLLDNLHQEPGTGEIEAQAAMIADTFGAETLEGIIEKLKTPSAASRTWAEATLADLMRRSPTSLKITDRHIRSCRALDLRETLIQDYRLAWRCLEASDFAEGVRAALVDKDNKPDWKPAAIDAVGDEEVARYFAPLGENDLVLPTREQMQAARV